MDLKDRKEGDVLRYDAFINQYGNHAREGIAIVRDEDGELVARDSFWDAFWASGGKALTLEELETAEFKFNHADYRIVDHQTEWEKYHPNDRQALSEQHQHRHVYLIREGAQPSLHTQIENARHKVDEARDNVRSAEMSLEFRLGILDELLAQADKQA